MKFECFRIRFISVLAIKRKLRGKAGDVSKTTIKLFVICFV